jgi:hypothetical protein
VTPILGAFDNGNLKQRKRNFARMFKQAGLPVPVRVNTIPRHDRFFVSKSHGHDKLPRFHMAVEFEKPVSGVVAAGAGLGKGYLHELRNQLILLGRAATQELYCTSSEDTTFSAGCVQ